MAAMPIKPYFIFTLTIILFLTVNDFLLVVVIFFFLNLAALLSSQSLVCTKTKLPAHPPSVVAKTDFNKLNLRR